MKKLIIFIFLIFLIATTFLSDNPPGWYQQAIPVNKAITDIYFIDSLTGWTCTNWDPQFDSAYIMRTTNGGNNWDIQLRENLSFSSIQFFDDNNGYCAGGDGKGKFLYTTNGGVNWIITTPFGSGINNIEDFQFINIDTGWICSDDDIGGGIFKTTNGGNSWQRQTTASQLAPVKLFFINKDTGWALSDGAISKTINGGSTWSFLNGVSGIERDLFFLNNDTGWVISADNNPNGIIKTTNGGIDFFVQLDPNPFGSGPNNIFILNNNKGWIAANLVTILSLANDSTWGKQSVPSGFPAFKSIQLLDSITGYSGGTIFVKTEDGGGIITDIENNSSSIPKNFILYQNYPNPFNPNTIINYELGIKSFVNIKVFDINGKEIKTLVNQKKDAGKYEIKFSATEGGLQLTSGVYFYRIEGVEDNSGKSFTETKKTILIR